MGSWNSFTREFARGFALRFFGARDLLVRRGVVGPFLGAEAPKIESEVRVPRVRGNAGALLGRRVTRLVDHGGQIRDVGVCAAGHTGVAL